MCQSLTMTAACRPTNQPTPTPAFLQPPTATQPEEVPHTVRCIVRCGAGVNNIPVQKMTELGIPVRSAA